MLFFGAGLGLRCSAGFSVAAARGGYVLQCAGFSSWSTGFRRLGSAAVAPRLQSTVSIVNVHRLSCSAACGIFPDQGLNPCLLHWQADSLPLGHQGSPLPSPLKDIFIKYRILFCLFKIIWLCQVLVAACRISSCLTRDRTRAQCNGSLESQPPEHSQVFF